MKILITGATGFVGKTLIPYLFEKGITDICLLVRNEKKANHLFGNLPLKYINTQTNDWRKDIIEFNPDTVLHLATYFNTSGDPENAKKIIESNITFTTLLLEAISHTNCHHFINIGTFSEFLYGDGKYYPNNLYSASKTAVRSIIQFYQTQSDWNWINIIFYSPYGRKNDQKKVIDYMVDALDAQKPIKFSKGEQILDFIHVDDIADFFYTLFSKLKLFTELYTQLHLGTGKGYSLRELGFMIEKVSGKKMNADWGGYPYRPLDIMHAVAPISKNIELLNWKTSINLEEGLRIFLDDIKKDQ